jgi:hypothetical protein
VPFIYSAADNVGVAKVHYQRANNANVVVKPSFVHFVSTSAMTDGQNPVKLTAFDTSGNSTVVNTSLTVNNATPADTVKPTLTLSAPAEGATVSGVTPVTIAATDNKSVAMVELKLDDSTGTPFRATKEPYSTTLNTVNLSEGAHKVTATAYDSTGNTTVVVRNFTVRNTTTPTPPPTNPPTPPPTNPPSPPPTNPPNPPNPNPTPKPGDLNNDGKVNISDLSILLSNWGKTGATVTGDINKDGKVNISDLSTLLSNWTR